MNKNEHHTQTTNRTCNRQQRWGDASVWSDAVHREDKEEWVSVRDRLFACRQRRNSTHFWRRRLHKFQPKQPPGTKQRRLSKEKTNSPRSLSPFGPCQERSCEQDTGLQCQHLLYLCLLSGCHYLEKDESVYSNLCNTTKLELNRSTVDKEIKRLEHISQKPAANQFQTTTEKK